MLWGLIFVGGPGTLVGIGSPYQTYGLTVSRAHLAADGCCRFLVEMAMAKGNMEL